jgi:hypothetical protein
VKHGRAQVLNRWRLLEGDLDAQVTFTRMCKDVIDYLDVY